MPHVVQRLLTAPRNVQSVMHDSSEGLGIGTTRYSTSEGQC